MTDYFAINGDDTFSSLVAKGGLKVDYETLVSDSSGRNAKGDLTVDVINHKYKVGVTFRSCTPTEVASIMSAIDDYVISISFFNPKTNSIVTKTCYTSTPSITWNTLATGKERTNTFSINFIEL